MADSQVPGALTPLAARSASLRGGASQAGTSSRTDDQMIPPPAQRAMSERAGSNRDRSLKVVIRFMCRTLQRWLNLIKERSMRPSLLRSAE